MHSLMDVSDGCRRSRAMLEYGQEVSSALCAANLVAVGPRVAAVGSLVAELASTVRDGVWRPVAWADLYADLLAFAKLA